MDTKLATVSLKSGREKPVRNRHPWIFSGAVDRIGGEAQDGDLVRVTDRQGRYLATGYLNRRSQIVVRLLTWDAGEAVDTGFWRRRLERAIAGRVRLAEEPETDAYRLVHAEADGLPGLIVDRYGDWLVVQCLTLGMARRRDETREALASCDKRIERVAAEIAAHELRLESVRGERADLSGKREELARQRARVQAEAAEAEGKQHQLEQVWQLRESELVASTEDRDEMQRAGHNLRLEEQRTGAEVEKLELELQRLAESRREYIKGAMLVDMLKERLGLPAGTDATIWDLSVGYDLAGIRSEPVQAFTAINVLPGESPPPEPERTLLPWLLVAVVLAAIMVTLAWPRIGRRGLV